MHFWNHVRAALSVGSRWDLRRKDKQSRLREAVRAFVLRRTKYPLQSVGQQGAIQGGRQQAIPATVVQTWVSDAFGRRHAQAIRAFRALNPDLNFLLHSHADADSYLASAWGRHPIHEIYSRAKFRTLQADIFRYCILFERGGYYFDINKGCSVPLRSLHASRDRRLLSCERSFCSVMPDLKSASSFQYPDRYLIQWGFGFAPTDPILKRVIDSICACYPFFRGKVFEYPKAATLAFTGPGMFTKAVREDVQAGGCLEGAQVGIEFHGYGISWMPGSEVRYHLSSPYVLARNQVIVE